MEAIGVQKFSAVITNTASIDEIKTIVENSKMIVNYFKFHVQAAAKLKRIQGENYNKEIAHIYSFNCLFSFQKINALSIRVSEISCNFSNNIQQLVQKRWDYTYHPVMMAAYMLDPCFLEESKNTDIKATGYREFTEFTSKRFGQKESVIMFTELVKFRQKNLPYDNKTIWLSSTNLSPSVWWQSWPNSSLQQLAIKILSISTSSAAAERNFSTFGFIHNKICNRLQNERVKKLDIQVRTE
ncbi:unnamed protein product [Rhizophagus irregularis]|nr:unnamed protein product [Rhizophagus irregularis]